MALNNCCAKKFLGFSKFIHLLLLIDLFDQKALADDQKTECQKDFDAMELVNSAPSVPNGKRAEKWLEKNAFGAMCCLNFEPKFDLNSFEDKNILNIYQKIKSDFCRELGQEKSMEMAAPKVQNSAIKFAQILESDPKIRKNIQKAEENAKNGAKLDKFEMLQWKSLLFKNNLPNVKIDRLMESVYLAFNGFVKALNEPKCQNVRQLCPMAMPATTGRRRRRQMDTIRGTFGIEQPPQAPQEICTCKWCQHFILLTLGVLSFISIMIAFSMLAKNASHQNILFMCGSVAVFLCSLGVALKVYTTVCNNCCANA